MTSIFLTSYTIRLIDRNSHDPLLTDNFQNGEDLFNLMNHNFNSLRTTLSNDTDLQKLLRVTRYSSSSRIITGVIQSGAYGFESDLLDTQSGALAHHRSVNEADMLPFYFLVHVPNNSDQAILILQRFGINGIKTIFTKYYSDYFVNNYPDILFEINPLIPGDYLSTLVEDGRFTKIRFIKFGVPHDFADVYSNDGHIEREGYFEQTITVPRGYFLQLADRIRGIRNGQLDLKSMYEIPNDYDKVKVEVELNGRYRTIDLSNLDRFRPYYDITDEVDIGTDGHPVFNSINGIARELLSDIASTIGNSDVQ